MRRLEASRFTNNWLHAVQKIGSNTYPTLDVWKQEFEDNNKRHQKECSNWRLKNLSFNSINSKKSTKKNHKETKLNLPVYATCVPSFPRKQRIWANTGAQIRALLGPECRWGGQPQGLPHWSKWIVYPCLISSLKVIVLDLRISARVVYKIKILSLSKALFLVQVMHF